MKSEISFEKSEISLEMIIVGAGGLILPDSNPNKISCWQWGISAELYSKITKPIYVISLGYNLFLNQNMNMSNHNNNKQDINRIIIFKKNITELIKISSHFSMRHKWDIEELIKIVGEEYRNKIIFEFCPTIWYSETYWKNKLEYNENKYIAIEIKDDREWRRYKNKNIFYKGLLNFVIYCNKNNIKVCYLSHDGSNNFYKYLKQNKINIPKLDNSISNEKVIYQNYNKIHTILCTAGHSQMISYGLGIKIIPLVSHPKIKNFCDDINFNNYIEINEEKHLSNKIISFL